MFKWASISLLIFFCETIETLQKRGKDRTYLKFAKLLVIPIQLGLQIIPPRPGRPASPLGFSTFEESDEFEESDDEASSSDSSDTGLGGRELSEGDGDGRCGMRLGDKLGTVNPNLLGCKG